MPALRSFNASSAVVKRVADAALDDPAGCVVTWFSRDIGLAACRQSARSFQTSFSSLRARARRQRINHVGDASNLTLDLEVVGPYDCLACTPRELPEGAGWSVSLLKADTALQGVTITSASTGEPIDGIDRESVKKNEILNRMIEYPHTVTRAEYDFVIGGNAERKRLADEFFTPHWEEEEPARTFVGQDALLDELGDDAFAEISNEGNKPA